MISGVSMGDQFLHLCLQSTPDGRRRRAGIRGLRYVDLLTTLTVLKQSSATWVDCRQATFAVSLGAGIGYSMPKVVASVINAVLGLFGVKPIPPWGSIVALPKRVELVGRRDCTGLLCR